MQLLWQPGNRPCWHAVGCWFAVCEGHTAATFHGVQCAVEHCTTYTTNTCTCTACDTGFKLVGGSCVAVSAVASWDGQGWMWHQACLQAWLSAWP